MQVVFLFFSNAVLGGHQTEFIATATPYCMSK